MSNQPNNRPTTRQRLEAEWQKWSKRSLSDPLVAKTIDRLETEIDSLAAAGSGWVKRDIAGFGDVGNYLSYSLEVHIAAAFRAKGVTLRHGQKLLQPINNSDVDFVHQDPSGRVYNLEVVCVNEWEKTWTEIASGNGITLFSLQGKSGDFVWDEEDETFQTRRLQDKLRVKTIEKGSPRKFPDPAQGGVNILIADVSGIWGSGDPDEGDLMLSVQGCAAVPDWVRLQGVLGLVEQRNSLGSGAEDEFQSNKFFRERVHAMMFLMDKSDWHNSLDPDYTGMLIANPALVSASLASEVCACVQTHFGGLVSGWLREP